MRSTFRDLFLRLFGHCRSIKSGIHLVNSHSILNNEIDCSDLFEQQLKYLSKYASFISFEEASYLIKINKIPKYPVIAFSYDDGFQECFTHIVPVLDIFHIKAAFFINPNYIEADTQCVSRFNDVLDVKDKQPMSWSQIIELHNQNHLIGAHTLDHVNIGNITDISELHLQLGGCKDLISKKIQSKCDHFAFPFGQMSHINELSLKIAQEYYDYIFSGTNYINYFSMDGRIINRRHIEPFWPLSHVKYFLSKQKKWE